MSRWLHWFPFSVFCLTKLKSRCQWSWILSGTSGKESTSEIFQAYTWNWHNIVNQLYSNKIKKKNLSDCWQNPVPCGWRIKTFLLAGCQLGFACSSSQTLARPCTWAPTSEPAVMYIWALVRLGISLASSFCCLSHLPLWMHFSDALFNLFLHMTILNPPW